jgi:PAB-dependent poly(A)-specific ribonuclease subunit 2
VYGPYLRFIGITEVVSVAGALGVVDYQAEGLKRDYGAIIQVFNRFLLEEMSARSDVPDGNPWLTETRTEDDRVAEIGARKSVVTQLMGIDAQSLVICGTCGSVTEKDTLSHVVDLTFLRKVSLYCSYPIERVLE